MKTRNWGADLSCAFTKMMDCLCSDWQMMGLIQSIYYPDYFGIGNTGPQCYPEYLAIGSDRVKSLQLLNSSKLGRGVSTFGCGCSVRTRYSHLEHSFSSPLNLISKPEFSVTHNLDDCRRILTLIFPSVQSNPHKLGIPKSLIDMKVVCLSWMSNCFQCREFLP